VSDDSSLETLSETRIAIRQDTDIVLACQKGRTLAAEQGLSDNDQVVVVIIISELAHNILRYATPGEIILASIRRGKTYGVGVVARDTGPGIANIERALQGGYSTGGGLGQGLSGVRRLADEFEIASEAGQGTSVTIRKWKQQDERR
jgi:serine/threonine-protein kinase RsbT